MPITKTPTKKVAPKAARKVTLDDVWATIDRIGKAHEETERGFRKLQKAHEETEKGFQELKKSLKETQRIMGDLGNKFGDIAEQMLTPALVKKFEKLTFPFTEINRNVRWEKKEAELSIEIDALLVNGTAAMVVEVKSKLKKEYVDDFIDKMAKVRRIDDMAGRTRKLYGALGAMTAEKPVIKYTLDKGLYLIMPSGEDVKITPPSVAALF